MVNKLIFPIILASFTIKNTKMFVNAKKMH